MPVLVNSFNLERGSESSDTTPESSKPPPTARAVTRGLARAVSPTDRKINSFGSNATTNSIGIIEKLRTTFSNMIIVPAACNGENLQCGMGKQQQQVSILKVDHHQKESTPFSKLLCGPMDECNIGANNNSKNERNNNNKKYNSYRQYAPDNFFDRTCVDLDFADMDLSRPNSEEDELMQMKRLTSWDTNGTLNTQQSDLDADSYVAPKQAQTDDDGNLIDAKILERTIETRGQRTSNNSRKRLVKFEYPPVSSLRQCPRPDPNDLPRLYFTEEELEQIEDDRESTFTADDVEVVAVSSSVSEDVDIVAQPKDKFGSYIATPKKGKFRRRNFGFDEAGQKASKLDPAKIDGKVIKSKHSSSSSRNRDPRLIKSVQIYLRERSTGA